MLRFVVVLLLVTSPVVAASTVTSALDRGLATRGVIGPHQARVAEKRLALLSGADRAKLEALVKHAGSDEEAAFLLKTVAAGYSTAATAKFADQIRGKSVRWLQRHLTAGDTLQSMTGTRQVFSMSCQASVAITLRTESDPIFALKLHTRNPQMNMVHSGDAYRFSPDLAKREERMLQSPDTDGVRAVAVARSLSGGVGRTALDLLNRISNVTALRYEGIPRGDEASGKGRNLRHLVAQMTRALEDGQMVPIEVTFKDSSHLMLAMHTRVDRDAGVPVRLFQIHEPWNGNTGWVSQRELLADRIRLSSQAALSGIYAPKPVD